jgi:hypothetical protein
MAPTPGMQAAWSQRQLWWLADQLVLGDCDHFGLSCARCEADHLVAHGEVRDRRAKLVDVPSEVVALALGEPGRPEGREDALADADLARIEGGGDNPDDDLIGTRRGPVDGDDLEHLGAAVPRELHCSRHLHSCRPSANCVQANSIEFARASK